MVSRAREGGQGKQGRACLPASRAVAARVAGPCIQRVGHEIWREAKHRSGFAASPELTERAVQPVSGEQMSVRQKEYETHPLRITVGHLDARSKREQSAS